jgi:hypothetical protein
MLQVKEHPLYKKHDIDSAMNSFWSFYKQRFSALFLISFVMSLIIQYGGSFIDTKELQEVAAGASIDPLEVLAKLKTLIVPFLILSVVSLFFSNILHYYILMKPLDSSKNIFVSIQYSLKYFIPYLIIIVILAFFGSFIMAAGLLVFVVGVIFSMLYLMMISFFILPVMMTEGNHIGNTILRTIRLSHRNFWKNIGWTSVFLVLFIVFTLVISAISMLPFTGTFLKTIAHQADAKTVLDIASNPFYIILSAAGNAIILPFLPIFGFLLYFSHRAGEETGSGPSYGDENYKVKVEDLYAKPIRDEEQGRKEGEKG